jgi:hypothetical protein
MLLLVANVYDVPELNFGYYFYKRSDVGEERDIQDSRGEHSYLHPSGSDQPRYTDQGASATSQQAYYQQGAIHGESSRAEDMRRLTEE